MEQRRALGEGPANDRLAAPSCNGRATGSRHARAWSSRIGVGAVLLTAALLMSACADASSTTGDAASAPSKSANPAGDVASNTTGSNGGHPNANV
ncbi:MAG TPA: hypothetical protein VF534_09175, partial [Paraburkholderia sp.]